MIKSPPSNDNHQDVDELPAGKKCVICAKPASKAERPFCSKRCRLLDLGRWLDGRYGIPGDDGDALEEDQ